MGRIFQYENPVMQGIRKAAKCVFLSVLWLLCSLPVITIGPSTAALYYAVEKSVKHERGYEGTAFFGGFRKNFRQSLAAGLILTGIEVIFLCDIWILQEIFSGYPVLGNLWILFAVLMILVLLYSVWLFAGIARFENTLPILMKNSLLLMIGHLGTTILTCLILGFVVLIIWLMPITIVIMPVVGMWLISVCLEKTFVRYQPDAKWEELPGEQNVIL